jgi:hypothetical protein
VARAALVVEAHKILRRVVLVVLEILQVHLRHKEAMAVPEQAVEMLVVVAVVPVLSVGMVLEIMVAMVAMELHQQFQVLQ